MSNQTKLSSCSLQRTPLTDDDLVNVSGGGKPNQEQGAVGQSYTLSRGDAYEQSNGNIFVVTTSKTYYSGNDVPTQKFTAGSPVIYGQGVSVDVAVEDLINTNIFNPIPRYANF